MDTICISANHKKTYEGKGLAIVGPKGNKGTATLTASAPGLKDGVAQINMK